MVQIFTTNNLCAPNLFSKYPKQQRQDDADNNTGGDGKIETEFFFSNDDIPREFADPWDLFTNQ